MKLNSIFRSAAATIHRPFKNTIDNGLVDLRDLVTLPRGQNEATIRSLCNVAFLGGGTALCRILGRYKMFVDTHDVGLSSHLMLDGYWEMWVTEALIRVITPGMVVADIGANVGYFTVLMADLVGHQGKVHAFEPNKHLVERLANSLSVNGFSQRVDLHNVALADTDGEVMLVIPPDEPKNAQIVPFNGEPQAHGVIVPAARLDGRPDWSQIEFAKIDVEGAEQLLWAGMQGLLEGSALKGMILEFNAARYADGGAFLDLICAAGFSLSYIDFSRGVLPTTREEVLAQPWGEDVMLYLAR